MTNVYNEKRFSTLHRAINKQETTTESSWDNRSTIKTSFILSGNLGGSKHGTFHVQLQHISFIFQLIWVNLCFERKKKKHFLSRG